MLTAVPGAGVISLPLNLSLHESPEIVEADRLFKITSHGLHSKGALKYFLIIFASTPLNIVNQELFPKHTVL